MTLKPRKTDFTPPPEMVGGDDVASVSYGEVINAEAVEPVSFVSEIHDGPVLSVSSRRGSRSYGDIALVGEDGEPIDTLEALQDGIAETAEMISVYMDLKSATPSHDWISYCGTDITYGPDCQPLPSDASLFVVTGEFTKLNPARMTVGELIDAKDKLSAPVMYRVA